MALALLSLSGVAIAHAEETSGAFAIRGGSARSAVLGEAYGALGEDADAAYWNPAAIITVHEPHVQATYHDVYGLGIAHHTSLSLAWRAGRESVNVHGDSIVVVTEENTGPAFAFGVAVLGVDLEGESYYELAPMAAMAVPLSQGSTFGVTARVLRASSGIEGVSALGYTLDLGVHQEVGRLLRAALAFRNVIGQLNWDGLPDETLPREAVGSLAILPLPQLIAAAGAGSNLDGDAVDRYHLAIEIRPWLDRAWITGGWEGRRSGDDLEGRLVAGARLATGRIATDYAFVAEGETPGDTHRLTLTIFF